MNSTGALWPIKICGRSYLYNSVSLQTAAHGALRLARLERSVKIMAGDLVGRRDEGFDLATGRRRSGLGAVACRALGHMSSGCWRDCRVLTAIDGHPATLGWPGSVESHRTMPLRVEHFGQTGTISDLYRHFGIDTFSIVEKVNGLTAGRRIDANRLAS
jgi:pyruvate dehydrogenase E1 component